MPHLESLTLHVRNGSDLDDGQVAEASRLLASPELGNEIKKDFLTELAKKGESISEVAAFVRVFRGLARDPEVSDFADRAIDVVGTGGDHSNSFNISTTVSFILAAGGVPVIKHGNRSITSKSGSADLLSAIGINIQSDNAQLRRSLESLNYCFLFAPAFHPAFKEIMPVRRELAEVGQRTIFNLLGPLINPGLPAHQMIGVYSKLLVHPVAQSLNRVGVKRGIVVHGILPDRTGMDELSCAGENQVCGFGELSDVDAYWTPEMSGLPRCVKEDLIGGSSEDNLRMLYEILDGKGNSGLVNTILFNASTAFWVAGVSEGLAVARDLLLGGAVKEWLERARQFYADAG
jgi:anthranilate phosphoribosyltransferase